MAESTALLGGRGLLLYAEQQVHARTHAHTHARTNERTRRTHAPAAAPPPACNKGTALSLLQVASRDETTMLSGRAALWRRLCLLFGLLTLAHDDTLSICGCSAPMPNPPSMCACRGRAGTSKTGWLAGCHFLSSFQKISSLPPALVFLGFGGYRVMIVRLHLRTYMLRTGRRARLHARSAGRPGGGEGLGPPADPECCGDDGAVL